MKLVRITFFIFLIAFSFGICLLTTEVYSVSFGLSEYTSKILKIFAIILPSIFITSSFLGLIDDDHYLKRFLYLINFSAGLTLYLFLSAVGLSILILISSGISVTLPISVSIVSLSTAIIFGFLGAIQAKMIKVTNYKIVLKGAPESWNKKTAVLVSDTHFGLINHKRFSDKIVESILKINPDFVIHAGDFYDGPKNKLSPITESWKVLTEKIPVFYTSGNHELYGDYNAFISSIRDAGINVLLDESLEHDGVQIAGITYRAKNKIEKAQEAMDSLNVDKNKPLILINHPPTFHDSAIKLNADLMVSGHTHKGQFWPIGYITQIMYKRYFYGIHKKQNLTTITTSGVGTSGPPIRLFNIPELVVIKFSNN